MNYNRLTRQLSPGDHGFWHPWDPAGKEDILSVHRLQVLGFGYPLGRNFKKIQRINFFKTRTYVWSFNCWIYNFVQWCNDNKNAKADYKVFVCVFVKKTENNSWKFVFFGCFLAVNGFFVVFSWFFENIVLWKPWKDYEKTSTARKP